MFLKKVIRDNPQLLDAAVMLHQEGKIPPNTFVYDLDVVSENAKCLAAQAKEHGLKTYLMTKQFGRNPFIVRVALQQGIDSTVAVDVVGARTLNRFGIPVGHVGHLSQVPRKEMPAIIAMRPEVITVYSVEAARYVSEAAAAIGVTQDILIKGVNDGDLFFPGQESGFMLSCLKEKVAEILKLSNVRIAGVTAFPCVKYNTWSTEFLETSPNFETLLEGARMLRDEMGIPLWQINAPGNTSCETYPILAAQGVTHVEPGHGLTGTTPEHIFNSTLPERAASVYVSEISHHFREKAYCFGGGLYVCLAGYPESAPVKALVGNSPDTIRDTVVTWEKLNRENIDYYGMLTPGDRCKIGDTVIFGFRSQAFFTRAYTAAVSGIHSGKPIVEGVFDSATNLLDNNYEPVSAEEVIRRVDRAMERYL